MSKKYPRTFHLPFSPGGTKDDRKLTSVEHFLGHPLVCTEKMDGSNVCLERRNVFARSHSGAPTHPSFDALKQLHAGVKHLIDPGIQIFGEWVYAVHSIKYEQLPSYLMLFGVRDNDCWQPWEDVELWAEELKVNTAPVLFKGSFTSAKDLQEKVEELTSQPSLCGGEREGVVVRLARHFWDRDFGTSVAKWVRKDHVQTDDHWSSQAIVKNGLQAR